MSRMALEGVRVIEVTANWAGPLAGRLLADLGAEVIKIEYPRRPATRGGRAPGGDSTVVRGYNRGGYFNKMNRNKHDLTLDLGHPKGKELFIALARRSDVLVENNSARVMSNFGLDYQVLSLVNPRLVMISMPGFGMTGPERDYMAYGSNIETTSGYASLLGYGDGQPFRTGGFYGDPVAGAHGAFAVLAALHNRRRTGQGQLIDLSLNESLMSFLGEAFLEYGLTGRDPSQQGNRHPRMAPHGCYRCSGQDQWVAIAVRDDQEWTRLCAAVGHAEWAERIEWATLAGRLEHHDELDAAISEWTKERDHYEVMRALQAAGVPAGAVLQNWEMLSDPHVYHRGFYVMTEHPETGVLPFPGMPWKLSATPGSVRLPAPLFGQHNQDILGGILGLSTEEIAQLEAEEVISRVPLARGD